MCGGSLVRGLACGMGESCVRDGGVMRARGIMWSFFDFKLYSIFFSYRLEGVLAGE